MVAVKGVGVEVVPAVEAVDVDDGDAVRLHDVRGDGVLGDDAVDPVVLLLAAAGRRPVDGHGRLGEEVVDDALEVVAVGRVAGVVEVLAAVGAAAVLELPPTWAGKKG